MATHDTLNFNFARWTGEGVGNFKQLIVSTPLGEEVDSLWWSEAFYGPFGSRDWTVYRGIDLPEIGRTHHIYNLHCGEFWSPVKLDLSGTSQAEPSTEEMASWLN